MESNQKTLWLGLDVGSGSVRALLLDAGGRSRLAAREPLRPRRAGPLSVVYDAGAILRAASRCLRKAAAAAPRGALRGIGLAAQRSTFVLWRRADGAPLTPAFGWQSRDGLLPAPAAAARRLVLRTGLRLSPHYSAPRLAALLARRPGLRRGLRSGAVCFGTLDTFLVYRWTRGACFRTDPTHAQRTLLYSLRTRGWDPDLLRLFGVPRRALATIGPSAGLAIPLRGFGAPLCASCGDQQAALAAARGAWPRACLVNYGTGAFVLVTRPPGGRTPRGFLQAEAVEPDGAPGRALEAPIPTAAAAFDLLTPSVTRRAGTAGEGRGPALEVSRIARGARTPAAARAVLVAATDGIGAPFWLERAPSLLVFDRLPGAAAAAAIAEASIAAAVQAALERLDPYPARLVASGGLSERDGLLTLQATLAGRAVVRASLSEWTALGAALLAAGRRRPRRLRLRLERFSPARSRSREARRSFLLWKRAVKFLESSGF